jgi:hypothetical protein
MNRSWDCHNRVTGDPGDRLGPFFLALATPGTAVEDEPGHLARFVGVPANLGPATLTPLISGWQEVAAADPE